ncbi:MAG: hypothetical protein COW84_02515 [Gammaproteobacteria bacterium CG22_combo_CG10-13_8_21_14_all_40_8]|nr:MAG: hypothetical protein COW84_02515 [Gammaproteobacteria bacterium CG22_combo_CG10-13_8_21_14_all_40_8]
MRFLLIIVSSLFTLSALSAQTVDNAENESNIKALNRSYGGKNYTNIKQHRHLSVQSSKEQKTDKDDSSEIDKFNHLLKQKPSAAGKPRSYSGHDHSHKKKFN